MTVTYSADPVVPEYHPEGWQKYTARNKLPLSAVSQIALWLNLPALAASNPNGRAVASMRFNLHPSGLVVDPQDATPALHHPRAQLSKPRSLGSPIEGPSRNPQIRSRGNN